MAELKKGDIVTIEATVTNPGDVTTSVQFHPELQGLDQVFSNKDLTFKERPKPPMPTEVGTILRESATSLWLRTEDGWVASWFKGAFGPPAWSDDKLEFHWNKDQLTVVDTK